MSHFTVLVIGDDVEKALAPFHEFECTGQDDEHVQHIDCFAEYKAEFDGDDDDDPDYATFPKYLENYFGLAPVEGSVKPDFEDKHKYGYFRHVNGTVVEVINRTNPNRKWDWWQLGGRWSGMLKLKENANSGINGNRSWANPGENETGWTDSCLVADLDLEGMESLASAKATAEFHKFYNEVLLPSNGNICPSWTHIRTVMFPGDIERARHFYNSHPFTKLCRKVDDNPFGKCAYEKYYLEEIDYKGKQIALVDVTRARECYIAKAVCQAFSTFAVLKDGKWYERGEMGWFACVSNEQSEYDWDAEFQKLVHDLPGETRISVVDCHI